MYRLVVDEDAVEQIAVLPDSALPGLAAGFDLLEVSPATGRPYNDDLPDGPMRELTFGAGGYGVITYLVLEDRREVHVLVVQWLDGPEG